MHRSPVAHSYTSEVRPSNNLHVEWVADEAVVLNPATGELYYLNPPAALVLAFIDEYGFAQGLVELREAHGARPGFEKELAEVLEDMQEKGLLTNE